MVPVKLYYSVSLSWLRVEEFSVHETQFPGVLKFWQLEARISHDALKDKSAPDNFRSDFQNEQKLDEKAQEMKVEKGYEGDGGITNASIKKTKDGVTYEL